MKKLKKLFCVIGLGLIGLPIMASDCNSLVSSCYFESSNPENGEAKDIIFDAIASTKIKVNDIFSPITYRPQWEGATDSVAYAGTVKNPHDVNANFIDVEKNMLIVHIPSKDKVDYKLMNLVSYQVAGFKPGTEFQMTFTVQAVDEVFADDVDIEYLSKLGIDIIDLNIGINCGPYGNSSVAENQLIELNIGESKKVTLTGTVPQDMTTLSLDILAGYNYRKGCTFGISDIEVTGCIVPKVKTTSYNVCAGESVNLFLDRDYKASSYEWMMKSPKGEFEPVGDRQKLLTEMNDLGTYSFYCLVDGQSSDTIDIYSQVGCEINGMPASLKVIFNDDFGYFEDEHTYVDANGNVQMTPSSYAPMRADVDYQIPEHKFDSNDNINDGYYAVIVPSPLGYATGDRTTAIWMNNITKDHTYFENRTDNGAALFANVTQNYKGVVYQKTVNGLCPGSTIKAETYIANISGGADSEVVLLIKDATSGDSIAKSVPYRTYTYGGWTQANLEFIVPEQTSSVTIEVISIGEQWEKGNDLLIDDIKLYTCSTPKVSLFTSLETLETSMTIRESGSFTLEAPVSELLKNYYGGNQLFLFQHSSDMNNWKNVAEASSENTITLESSVFPDTINYFRVVVATESTVKDVMENPNILEEWGCDNAFSYSVSNLVSITNLAPKDGNLSSLSNPTTSFSYYVEGQNLTVNAAEGSNVTITTPLGLTLANKKMEGNSETFNVKGQSIVILTIDGTTNKVIIK